MFGRRKKKLDIPPLDMVYLVDSEQRTIRASIYGTVKDFRFKQTRAFLVQVDRLKKTPGANVIEARLKEVHHL